MPNTLVVQQPSPYERARRRSNALLLSLGPRPTAQPVRQPVENAHARVAVCEVKPGDTEDDTDELQDMFISIPLTPPPRSPTSASLIVPLPAVTRGPPSPALTRAPAARTAPLPASAARVPAINPTSWHFGIEVGPATTQSLKACGTYLNDWLKNDRPPAPMLQRMITLRHKAILLATADGDITAVHKSMFCMTLELNRLLSVGRNAVLQQSAGAPGTAGKNTFQQFDAMAQSFQQSVFSITGALDLFENVAECSVVMARILGSYTRDTGMWAPHPIMVGAPPLVVALYASQRELLRHLRRTIKNLEGWSETIATQVRLLGCGPPDSIAPNTVFNALRHLQPFTLDDAVNLPIDALHLTDQMNAAQELHTYTHYARTCLITAVTDIVPNLNSHVVGGNAVS